jgi:hypothetical protein
MLDRLARHEFIGEFPDTGFAADDDAAQREGIQNFPSSSVLATLPGAVRECWSRPQQRRESAQA